MSPAVGKWCWWRAPTATWRPMCARWCGYRSPSSWSTARSASRAHAGGGGRFDYGYFTDERLRQYAREAVHQASVNLAAKPAPAGEHDRGAGLRLARHPAARGHRPRPGGRLQSQGQFRLRRPHRPAGGGQGRHGGGRRHHPRPARLAVRRRRGQPDPAHGADRGRHPPGLPAGHAQRPPDGRPADRQRPPRVLRPPAACRA